MLQGRLQLFLKADIIAHMVDVCNSLSGTDDINKFAENYLTAREKPEELVAFEENLPVLHIAAVNKLCLGNENKLSEFLDLILY